jgi:type IV secretion system protein VirB8
MLPFIKNKNNNEKLRSKGGNVVTEVKNWYSDRYSTIVAQRNILLLLIVILASGILTAIITVKEVTLSKTVKPFVIEVEDKSGLISIVDPLTTSVIEGDEVINTYFIAKYVRARETYDAMSYAFNYNNIVRLMSSSDVYAQFLRKINDEATSPIKNYGSRTATIMDIRSIQFLNKSQVSQASGTGNSRIAQIRFRIKEEGDFQGEYNKIATLHYKFDVTAMQQEDRYINPLGFIVISYRVDNEIL